MRFLDFCKSVAVNDATLTTNQTEDMSIGDIYNKRIRVLSSQFKCRASVLKDMDIPYVENVFKRIPSLSDKMVEICEKEFGGRNIPDVFFNKLSMEIFCKSFNELSADNKIIIKTLVMYILLQ